MRQALTRVPARALIGMPVSYADGPVHVSELSNRFVRDPIDAAKAGDRVTVRMMSVDVPRKRIALSMKTQPGAARPSGGGKPAAAQQGGAGKPPQSKDAPGCIPRPQTRRSRAQAAVARLRAQRHPGQHEAVAVIAAGWVTGRRFGGSRT